MSATIEAVLSGSAGPVPGAAVVLRRKLPRRHPPPTILGYATGPANDIQTNYTQIAGIFDAVWDGGITSSIASSMRITNPGIILMFYRLPGGVQSGTQYPDSYYVKDAVLTDQHIVNDIGWHLLDFSQAAVRQARRDDIASNMVSRTLDGYVTDMAQPLWRWNQDFGSSFWNSGSSTGPTATFPAGWAGETGLWATTYMLAWHQEMAADSRTANKYRFVDGYPSNASLWNADLAARVTEYLAQNSGQGSEAAWIRTSGWLSETDWKFELDRYTETLDSNKIIITQLPVETFPADPTLQQKRFCFASYLLLADGQKAWFTLASPNSSSLKMRWDTDYAGLIDVDYSWPDTSVNSGKYQTFAATPSGNIYKRTFLKYRVWVNPSGGSRTADGKTVPAHDAVFELR